MPLKNGDELQVVRVTSHASGRWRHKYSAGRRGRILDGTKREASTSTNNINCGRVLEIVGYSSVTFSYFRYVMVSSRYSK
eukprot:scaffold22560_cov135-Cylindrotheca_fusiformis.AAC.66